jgi:hypothetical protein
MATTKRDEAADRWTRLWGSLSSQQRRSAALAYLTAAESFAAARDSAVAVLARHARAARSTVTQWPLEDRAARLAQLVHLDPPFLAALLARYLVASHSPMVRRFLDLVDLRHTNGEIDPTATGGVCDGERLVTAIRLTAAEFPARDLEFFLDAIEGQRIPYLQGLDAARREVGGSMRHDAPP